jgi:LuxR family maltose regulon positive regulatory protein
MSSLLATKLYIPAPRPNRVPRTRLTERMERGSAGPLTLVSAPAGFGKSTLLSEWAHSGNRQVAWVSLDEGENDPIRFLCYVATALQRLSPGLGEDALVALRQMQTPSMELLEPVLTGLLNEVHALDQDVVLVLDDYHVIESRHVIESPHVVESPAVHQIVQFVLDRLPPRLHLVIATRIDPPLPLSRLRARGQLTEIRAQDLRFTPQEAADFLNHAMGLSLPASSVNALEERTEGWAVGLQMAALSLQGRADVRGFIQHFTGSHRYVLDYLTDEVLSRQPERLRDFLLRTAILNRLSGPLCDAVTGRQDGQAVLEELEAANLFLIPLDDTRTWYRYHHLFGTLLRHQLERKEGKAGTSGINILHERASDWFAANGHPEDALEHALAAGAHDRAVELVSQHALPRLMRGDAGTVLRWIQSLPPEWVRSRPWLRLVYTWALMATFQVPAAEAQVRELERELEREPDPELVGHIETLRGLITRIGGDTEGALALYRRAEEHLPEDDLISRSILAMELGFTSMLAGDFAAAAEAFKKAEAASRGSEHTLVVLMAQGYQAEIKITQGKLREAVEIARRSLRLASEAVTPGEPVSPAASMAFAVLAEVEREWNDLGAAMEHAGRALELGRRGGLADGLLGGSLTQMRVLTAHGDFPGAFEALERAEEVVRRIGQPRWLEVIEAFRARLHLRRHRVQGDPGTLNAALRWARDSGVLAGWLERREVPMLEDFRPDVAALTLARVLRAEGNREEALVLLAELRSRSEAAGWYRTVIEACCIEASIRQEKEDRDGALEAMRRALALAEPEGFVRIFTGEGPALAALVEPAAPGTVSPDYTRRLLTAFGLEAPEAAPAPPPSPSLQAPAADLLSDREIEVLRLIATGLSNAETGRKLFIAPSTVKKHLENIYDKLGTRSRTQAIARAREIGVL